jgi:hypothetical protein
MSTATGPVYHNVAEIKKGRRRRMHYVCWLRRQSIKNQSNKKFPSAVVGTRLKA